MTKVARSLSNDKYAAVNGANSPSSSNVFATMNDLGAINVANLGNSDLIQDTPGLRTFSLGGSLGTDVLSFRTLSGNDIFRLKGDRTFEFYDSLGGVSMGSNTSGGVTFGKNIGLNGATHSGFYGLNMLGDFNTNGNMLCGTEIRMQQSGFSKISSVGNKMLCNFAGGFSWGDASNARMTLSAAGQLNLSSIPTSSAGLVSGDVWNNSGVLTMV